MINSANNQISNVIGKWKWPNRKGRSKTLEILSQQNLTQNCGDNNACNSFENQADTGNGQFPTFLILHEKNAYIFAKKLECWTFSLSILNKLLCFAIIYSNTNSVQQFWEYSSLNLANFKDAIIFEWNPEPKNILHKWHLCHLWQIPCLKWIKSQKGTLNRVANMVGDKAKIAKVGSFFCVPKWAIKRATAWKETVSVLINCAVCWGRCERVQLTQRTY